MSSEVPPFESATGSTSGGALKIATRCAAGDRQRLVLEPAVAREDLAGGDRAAAASISARVWRRSFSVLLTSELWYDGTTIR